MENKSIIFLSKLWARRALAASCKILNFCYLRSLGNESVLSFRSTSLDNKLFLILHDIRSAYNVGAIFRTADGSGVSKIYLSGYTPAPAEDDKLAKSRADKMIEKTALGAEQSVSWEKCDDLGKLLESLKEENFSIVALEKNDDSIDIRKYDKKFPMAIILGNEVDGVDQSVLEKCDAVVSIPMRGKKESLNVSVAAGIAMYEMLS
ncbi:MAG: tRNA/rRNA methyltransferase (SpoU) [uncultured bacterium]|nr:MAG: tRNA/rRNA methyltransferase (SpoU) [uncultured bacterium]